MVSGAAVIDCLLKQRCTALCRHLAGSDSELLLLAFGRVNDQRIVSVKVSHQKQSGQIDGRDLWTEYANRTLVAQDWKEKGGARYFTESIEIKQEARNSRMRIMISAYDGNGVELASIDASQYTAGLVWGKIGYSSLAPLP